MEKSKRNKIILLTSIGAALLTVGVVVCSCVINFYHNREEELIDISWNDYEDKHGEQTSFKYLNCDFYLEEDPYWSVDTDFMENIGKMETVNYRENPRYLILKFHTVKEDTYCWFDSDGVPLFISNVFYSWKNSVVEMPEINYETQFCKYKIYKSEWIRKRMSDEYLITDLALENKEVTLNDLIDINNKIELSRSEVETIYNMSLYSNAYPCLVLSLNVYCYGGVYYVESLESQMSKSNECIIYELNSKIQNLINDVV